MTGAEPAATEFVYLGALDARRRGSDDGPRQRSAARERLASPSPCVVLHAPARGPSAGRALCSSRAAPQPVPGDAARAPLAGAAVGLGRVFALEQPARWGGLDRSAAAATRRRSPSSLLAALEADDGEDQVAMARAASAWRARLVDAELRGRPAAGLRGDATYLVTGGFGGLGLWSRAGWPSRAPGTSRLSAAGPILTDAGGARTRERSARRSIAARRRRRRPEAHAGSSSRRSPRRRRRCAGILHAAAALSAAPIDRADCRRRSRDVLRAKIDGTLVLERLAQTARLDFLVLFSSTTALLGAVGPGALRRRQRVPRRHGRTRASPGAQPRALGQLGHVGGDAAGVGAGPARRSAQAGLEPMASAEALDALGRLLAGDAASGGRRADRLAAC